MTDRAATKVLVSPYRMGFGWKCTAFVPLALNLSYLAPISGRTWQYRVKLKEWKLGVNGGRVGDRMERIVEEVK